MTSLIYCGASRSARLLTQADGRAGTAKAGRYVVANDYGATLTLTKVSSWASKSDHFDIATPRRRPRRRSPQRQLTGLCVFFFGARASTVHLARPSSPSLAHPQGSCYMSGLLFAQKSLPQACLLQAIPALAQTGSLASTARQKSCHLTIQSMDDSTFPVSSTGFALLLCLSVSHPFCLSFSRSFRLGGSIHLFFHPTLLFFLCAINFLPPHDTLTTPQETDARGIFSPLSLSHYEFRHRRKPRHTETRLAQNL